MKSTFVKYIFLSILIILLLGSSITQAAPSTIVEAEGQAAMGDDKSKKQTEEAALQEAKRFAIEYVAT